MKILLILVLLGVVAYGVIYLVFFSSDSGSDVIETLQIDESIYEPDSDIDTEVFSEIEDAYGYEAHVITDDTSEEDNSVEIEHIDSNEVNFRKIEGEGWNETLQINIYAEDERSIALFRIVSITDDMNIIEPMIADFLARRPIMIFDPSDGPTTGLRFVLVTYETAWPEGTPISEFGDSPRAEISLMDIEDIRLGTFWGGDLAPVTFSVGLTTVERPPSGYIVEYNILMQILEWVPLNRVAFTSNHASIGIDGALRATVVDIDNNIVATFNWE